MAEIRQIFVDTSAWLALANRNDQYHEAAVAFHRTLHPSVVRVTTWGIVAETYTWLRYHAGYRAAEGWLREEAGLEECSSIEVVFPTAALEAGIRRTLSRFADQDLSYVDALSLHITQSRADIDAIFAFDHHLTLGGMPVVPGHLAAGK